MRFLLLGLSFLFTACYVNERGISANYYNDCKAYYDAAGVYHKACDENIVDFSDVKKLATKKQTQADMALAAAKSEEERELAEIDKLEAQFEKEEEEKKAWQERINRLNNAANNAAVNAQNYQNITDDKKNPIDEERDFGSANINSSANSSSTNASSSTNQNELRSSDF